MKTSLHLAAIAMAIVVLTGCGKDDTPPPTPPPAPPAKGNVIGSITPANSATMAYLVKDADTLTSTIAADLSFQFMDVVEGSYLLSFQTATNFISPAPDTVIVTGNQTNNVGQITMLPPNGFLSVTIDGQPISGMPTFSPMLGNGRIILFVPGSLQIHIGLPVINGPGTFTTSNSALEFSVMDMNSNNWLAANHTGDGSLTVTYFDPVSKRGNATFSFTAEAAGAGATGTQVATNGSLQQVRLKN